MEESSNDGINPDVTHAQFLLKCQFYDAIFWEDQAQDIYQIIKSNEKVSKHLFPMIIQVVKCGSRAEQIYMDDSDIDYIYEIGPLLVGEKKEELKQDCEIKENKDTFYLDITKNPGFYTVCDREGGYLHPVALQSKFAPVFHAVKQMASLNKTSATLPPIALPPHALPPHTLQNPLKQHSAFGNPITPEIFKSFSYLMEQGRLSQVSFDEDSVMAFKCQKWPRDIWKNFQKRKPEHLNLEQLKEKSLYLIPKAHCNSENPWLEWRLSFSIVEKTIFESVKYIFRKVYLLCKSLTTIWNREYHFPSYVLKTVFLWTYEDWKKSKQEFTEDDLLNMMLQLFQNLYKYCKDGVVPMYFIPEANLLDQYSEKFDEAFITRIQAFGNLQSLSLSICKHFKEQFSSALRFCFDVPYFYREKIQENKGILDNEDTLELMRELYITLLFMLRKSMFSELDNNCLHVLYYLMVYGHSCIPYRLTLDFELIPVNFINMYFASIKKFVNDFFPADVSAIFDVSLDDNIKARVQNFLLQSFQKEELPENWINGNFDNHDMLFLHEWYRFGNREQTEKVHGEIMREQTFFELDLVFEYIASYINSRFEEKFKLKCFKEIKARTEARTHSVGSVPLVREDFLRHLVQDMFEMYSYGFTDGKFHLPTPAIYMSYLRQLVVNMKCKAQNELNNSNDNVLNSQFYKSLDRGFIIDGRISDGWGFCNKEGIYVAYGRRKAKGVPFSWTFIDK